MNSKTCNICKKELPLMKSSFQVRSNYKDGFDVSCRVCRLNKHKAYMENYRVNGASKSRPTKPEKIYETYGNEIYC